MMAAAEQYCVEFKQVTQHPRSLVTQVITLIYKFIHQQIIFYTMVWKWHNIKLQIEHDF